MEGTDFSRKVSETLIEQLKAGTAPWLKPWKAGENLLPQNAATGNHYHGINAVWLMSAAQERGFTDPRWVTYNQARAQGATVRRGETGTKIEFWKWDELRTVTDKDGVALRDDRGRPKQERVRLEQPKVFSAVVFNAEQVEGLEPLEKREPTPEWQRHERAEAILKVSGAAIEHKSGDRASYSVKDDAITLPEREQFETADRYYATALHELGHWTGHESRLGRDLAHPFGSQGYAKEELRAEIASLMLGQELGIGHDPGQHAAYVDHWVKLLEKEPREVFRAAADAEKILKFVRTLEQQQTQGPSVAESQGQSVELQVKAPVLMREAGQAQAAGERTLLAVPCAEKDEAKALGARWDKEAKTWFAPPGTNVEPLSRWLPENQPKVDLPPTQRRDPREEFASALREAGFLIEGLPEMDGRFHRVAVEGDSVHDRSGVYKGHLDGHPAGFLQNHRTGEKATWKSSVPSQVLAAEQRARQVAEAAERRVEREAMQEKLHERAADTAADRWMAARPVDGAEHPYLAEKGVKAHGLRQDEKGNLLVPLQDKDGKIWSLQTIRPDGATWFQKEGRVSGNFHALGAVEKAPAVIVAESYAAAATLQETRRAPVVVAFSAGNLGPVAEALREKYPEKTLYIAASQHPEKDGRPNPGREKAEQAAQAVGAHLLLPRFGEGQQGSDWNDLSRAAGAEEVKTQLVEGFARARRERRTQAAVRQKAQGASREAQAESKELEAALSV